MTIVHFALCFLSILLLFFDILSISDSVFLLWVSVFEVCTGNVCHLPSYISLFLLMSSFVNLIFCTSSFIDLLAIDCRSFILLSTVLDYDTFTMSLISTFLDHHHKEDLHNLFEQKKTLLMHSVMLSRYQYT